MIQLPGFKYEYSTLNQKHQQLSITAVVALIVSLAFCSFLISATIIDRSKLTQLRIEQQIMGKTHQIYETISKLLYKTQALSALIIHDESENFELIAPSIIDDPAIMNILLAPNGIVTKVYPLAGNENVIGLDFFREGTGNMEAMMARDRGELVLGGPFSTIQGQQALVGRMPVFIDTPEGDQQFWGLVSVTLKYPQVLESVDLNTFTNYGYSYELWRINPDDNEKQIIDSNHQYVRPGARFIEKPIKILNAQWYLRISPIRMWYNYPENIVLIIAGFCISLIIFFVLQNNQELRNMHVVFEKMATTDPLTGIFNRRHFLEIIRISLEKARRHKETCYLIMFDIDRFKQVNDTYGHQIGDKVLMDVTARIKADIRPYDLFARYGGEEFIIFTSGITKKEVMDMTERLRLSLCSRKYEYENVAIESSASFGIAQMYDYNLDKSIKHSDEALYAAKRNGRNCVVFREEEKS